MALIGMTLGLVGVIGIGSALAGWFFERRRVRRVVAIVEED